MAKKEPDYSKLKALHDSILSYIGDVDVGDDPKLPEQDNQQNDGGPKSLTDLSPLEDGLTAKADDTDGEEDGKRKKRKDDTMNLMASTLAARFNK